MKKFFAEFKEFISRGNVMDMAIGVIIATAFVAFVVFLVVKAFNAAKQKLEKPAEPEEPEPTKEELLLTEIRDLLKTKG